MQQYRELVNRIFDHGTFRGDRTGVGTHAVFGHHMRFDLADGFPLLTLKRTNFDAIKAEILWFLSGSTNIHYLGSGIWDEWADDTGNLGPIYGRQWRNWGVAGHDQIAEVINSIKQRPHSRRHIVSAWNVDDLPDDEVSPQENARRHRMALAPCHVLFQFYVANGRLSCQLYQRSADVFLGLPFNIAGYSMLTHMVAQVTGLQPGEFVHTLGDAHIYQNHMSAAVQMMSREDRPLPTLRLEPTVRDIDEFQPDHIQLDGYHPHPGIRAPIAI